MLHKKIEIIFLFLFLCLFFILHYFPLNLWYLDHICMEKYILESQGSGVTCEFMVECVNLR